MDGKNAVTNKPMENETDKQTGASRRTLLKTLGAVAGLSAVSTPAEAQPSSITGVYESNDGGRYYIRQSGDMVYWFGERERTDDSTCGPLVFANVFRGRRRNDNTIGGNWFDVPKGDFRNHGRLGLEIESDGSLTRTGETGGFAGSRWERTGGSVPNALRMFRQAGFQSFQDADLSGTWTCSDGGTYYVRQVDRSIVAWIGEHVNEFSNVFIGLRRSGNQIEGDWMDVPKYGEGNGGELRLRVTGDNEMINIGQTGGFGGSRWGRIFTNCMDD